MDLFDARVLAPRPIRTLSPGAQQRLLEALVEILPGERDWPHRLRDLGMGNGDVAPLLRQLVRHADATQARRYRVVFLMAFGIEA